MVIAGTSEEGEWQDGEWLDPVHVKAGMDLEFAQLDSFKVYEVNDKSPNELRKDGKRLISLTWVLKAKGGGVRARLVMRDFNNSKSDDYFSPTPAAAGTRIMDWAQLKYGLARYLQGTRQQVQVIMVNKKEPGLLYSWPKPTPLP